MPTIDNRGLNCPEPLVRTKKAMEKYREIISIVDNKIALENILKFAGSSGLQARWEEKGGDYYITVSGEPASSQNADSKDIPACRAASTKKTYLITSDEFGRGSTELGQLLMKNLIYTLTQTEEKPDYLIFVNSGVNLCTKDSPVLDDLAVLKDCGTSILACGTCLDYYRLKESFSEGQITNMYDIADILAVSEVITL